MNKKSKLCVFIIITFLGVCLLYACRKEHSLQNNKQADIALRIKQEFTASGFEKSLTNRLNDSLHITWVPLWDRMYSKVGSKGNDYYYIPLSAVCASIGASKKQYSITNFAYERYIIVQQKMSANPVLNFYEATYVKKNYPDVRRLPGMNYANFSGSLVLRAFSGETKVIHYMEGEPLEKAITRINKPSYPANETNWYTRDIGKTENSAFLSVHPVGDFSKTVDAPLQRGINDNECFTRCLWAISCQGARDGGLQWTTTMTEGGLGEACAYPNGGEPNCGDGAVYAVWQLISSERFNCILAGPGPGPGPGPGSGPGEPGGGGGNGGGGTGGEELPPLPQPSEIKNVVSDACLAEIINRIILNSWESKMLANVNEWFGSSKIYNITYMNKSDYKTYTGLEFDERAAAHSYTRTSAYGLDVYIFINNGMLLNASKEYTASVTLHEIGHAIMAYEGWESDDHNTMALMLYPKKMALALKELYPNFDLNDAELLSWEGFEGTPAWKAKIKRESIGWLQNVINKNMKHRQGLEGTKCK